MELGQCIRALGRWAWLIILSTILAAGVSYWSSSGVTPLYQATTTVQGGQFLESPDPLGSDIAISGQLAQAYAQAATRQPILQGTIDTLGLKRDWQSLAGSVKATVVGSQLLQITAMDTSPQRASAVANEVAHQLILQSPTNQEREAQSQRGDFVNRQLDSLQGRIESAENKIEDLQARLPGQSSAIEIKETQDQIAALQLQISNWQATYANLLARSTGGRTNYLTVFEPASVPRSPVSPNIPRNVALAAAIGFLLAAIAVLAREFLDDTVKTGEELSRVLGLPVLASIGRVRGPGQASGTPIAVRDPTSPVAEAFRVLRTNLTFLAVSNPTENLLVTSASIAEGKTTVACNLAIALAQSGRQVVLVDADLRRPDVHHHLGLKNDVGLSSLLLDESRTIEEALAETAVSGLRALTSGPVPPNPAELLASERMRRRLSQLREWAQVVVVDAPPALPVADASVLAGLCDGVVLVARAGRTRTSTLRQAKAAFDQVGAKVLGAVLNDRALHDQDYYHRYSRPRPGTAKRTFEHGERASQA